MAPQTGQVQLSQTGGVRLDREVTITSAPSCSTLSTNQQSAAARYPTPPPYYSKKAHSGTNPTKHQGQREKEIEGERRRVAAAREGAVEAVDDEHS